MTNKQKVLKVYPKALVLTLGAYSWIVTPISIGWKSISDARTSPQLAWRSAAANLKKGKR